ncbi:putative pyrimidine nucleoside phosphorylase [Geobacillus virus E3]|uniref:putative pyrimidine nucleoside phosphorylase n=1 Tax=Geobacillus virus E3 TaxID=1572712 RepID=UPI000671AD2E|nr:putative pyrimidine nucleoside phosphorylase [Geobacillus virus E3]AJA41374.1 putative pyrimidine nucleoside phosphorylase [Geobacillus virus E3]
MRMVDLIAKKRDGYELSKEEIDFIIRGYTNGDIPDYQMASMLMAIYFNGMSKEEISALTNAMINSGETIDLSKIEGVKVDKHSTGGVGDKISLIVAPLVASLGIPVAKMSGRGLGHTGGTIDKLESIQGFNVELTREQFINQVNTHKIALVGQSGILVPADKKLYALRDVTGTVNSIPLIASSIMSKKIAMGADAIVLDVKTGNGAFMKTLEDSKALAQEMVDIGKNLNRKTIAVITDMNQPLGYEVGNANEVKEAIQVLKGEYIEDLVEISLTIAENMVFLSGMYEGENIKEKLKMQIQNGQALNKFKEFIKIQGGNENIVDNVDLLPQAKYHFEIKSLNNGYIDKLEAEKIGYVAMLLGAGRKKKEDSIDHSAGVTLKKKIGDYVEKGEVLAILHCNFEIDENVKNKLLDAYSFTDKPVDKNSYVYEIIS